MSSDRTRTCIRYGGPCLSKCSPVQVKAEIKEWEQSQSVPQADVMNRKCKGRPVRRVECPRTFTSLPSRRIARRLRPYRG